MAPLFPCTQTHEKHMKTKLRAEQIEFVDNIYAAYADGHTSIMGVAATGFGKTVISTRLLCDWTESKSTNVAFLVDNNSLIDQTVERLRETGYEGDIGILSGDHERPFCTERVYIISLQTLERNETYLDYLNLGFVIFDEAHTTFFRKISKKVLSYPWLFLGLTATPFRSKTSQKFADYVTKIVLSPSHKTIEKNGALAPLKYYIIQSPDLTGLKIVGSEFEEAETARRFATEESMQTSLTALKDCYEIHGKSPTLVFERNVANANLFAEFLTDNFIYSEVVTGATPRSARRMIFERFRAGEIDAIVSCQALSKGFDMPCAVVGLDRSPTYSRTSYIQKVGRLARVFPGKECGIIIDAAANRTRHACPSKSEYTEALIFQGASDKPDAQDFKVCPACGVLNSPEYKRSETHYLCMDCGAEIDEVKIRTERRKPEEVGVDLQGKIALLSEGFMSKPEQTELYRRLLYQAYRRNMAPGWAYHEFRNKTKLAKPPRGSSRGAVLGPSPSIQEVIDYYQYLIRKTTPDQAAWMFKKETGTTFQEISRQIVDKHKSV